MLSLVDDFNRIMEKEISLRTERQALWSQTGLNFIPGSTIL